jgi:PAS domain S-box-containing protein
MDISSHQSLDDTATQAETHSDPAEQLAMLKQENERLQWELQEARNQQEKLQRRSEEQFRALLANIPGAVYRYVHEADWMIEFISDAIAEISGYSAKHFTGSPVHTLLSMIHPQDRETVEWTFQQSVLEEQPYVMEYRLLRTDGSTRWIYEKGRPILRRDGTVRSLDGVLFDITERKQAEEALRRSEATNRALVDAIPDLMIRMGADGSYLDFIPAKDFRNIMPAQEMSGKNIYEVMPARIAEERMRYVTEALRTGKTQVYEFAIAWEGLLSYEEARIAVSTEDEVLVIIRDITDRKKAEEELKQAKETLELRVRERTKKLQEQTVHLKQALRSLKRTQAQLIQTEKMSSLGQLVAGIAHEINNPINFIHGNLAHANQYSQDVLRLLKLYQQHYPNPVAEIQAEVEDMDLNFLVADLPKLLASMRTGTERIRQIVLSLRNFSRLDEAEVKLVDIHEGIDSTLVILQHRLKGKAGQSEIQVIKDYGNLPLVECYAGQLNQVFLHLLSNAIDAMEDELLLPCIHIRTRLKNLKIITICVEDNGRGMSSEIQQRIFDPFFTTKSIGQGTGLGLSICHQIIVDRHGGSIHCTSTVGKGSEFWIEIPIQRS